MQKNHLNISNNARSNSGILLKRLVSNVYKVDPFIYHHVELTPLSRFRKIVNLVKLLLHAVSSIKNRSTKFEKKTQVDNLGYLSSDGLLFDLNQFKRQKEIGLSDEVKRILRSKSENRNSKSIGLICTALLECVPEFNDFPSNIQKAIAKVSQLQEFQAGRVIIRQNHKADNFYFIISGITIVSALLRNKKTGELQNKTLAFLEKGKSFGELAIMHASARNATVTCHTDVSVLSIGRDDFIDIFMHVEHGKEPEHISFLREIEIFNKWPIEQLPHNDPRICLLTFFRKGVMMCSDCLNSDWIYVVKQGLCKVIKKIHLPEQNIYQIKNPNNNLDKVLKLRNPKKEKKIEQNKNGVAGFISKSFNDLNVN